MMKTISFIILVFIALSCSSLNNNGYYLLTTGYVPIKTVHIPDTVKLADIAQISAHAEEDNGCWSNLHFTLEKRTDFNYSLQAYGTFESYGTCPSVMVMADTIIDFKPALAGMYIFYITRDPYDIVTDTLIVQ